MFELALARLNVRPDETVMLGDRLDTDIDHPPSITVAGVPQAASLMDGSACFMAGANRLTAAAYAWAPMCHVSLSISQYFTP